MQFPTFSFRLLSATLAVAVLAACNTTPTGPNTQPIPGQQAALSLEQRIANAKTECQKTAMTKAQWYRCWIPQSEAAYRDSGYPYMDLVQAQDTEMLLVVRSLERGAFTPEQTDAMMAQSQLRFNNAVRQREAQNRDQEMESWRQFRSFVQNPY